MSQLEAMMETANAEPDAAVSEPAPEGEAAEGAPPPEGADPSEVGSDAATPPPAAATDPKKPADDPKVAARFAALAREKARSLAQSQQLEHAARQLAAREASLHEREAQISARLADAEKVLADPDKLFAHLESAFGIRSMEDLRKVAQGAWQKPKAEEKDPAKQPLTRAELEKWQADQDKQREAKATKEERESTFMKMSGDETKYEASALVFSARERLEHGDRIANQLNAKGIPWTFDDIADAVNELALADERYAKIQKRAAKPGAQASNAKPAAAAAAKATDSNGRQSSQARTLSNDAASERVNGSPAKRETHRERMARLAAS